MNPEDYHLATIEKIEEQRGHATTAELEADLDLLLTDAIAAALDHVRYGKIRPRQLDPAGTSTPVTTCRRSATLARVAEAGDLAEAIQAEAGSLHLQGAVGALAKMREVEASGGWGTVPPGRAIKPGASDPRVPASARGS